MSENPGGEEADTNERGLCEITILCHCHNPCCQLHLKGCYYALAGHNCILLFVSVFIYCFFLFYASPYFVACGDGSSDLGQ